MLGSPTARPSRSSVGIVGAGAVGTALGAAISRAGWPVVAVCSRDTARTDRFRAMVPSARALPDPAALGREVDLAILAVPDDAIVSVAKSMRIGAGRSLVHTSGLLGADVLRPAAGEGAMIGSFHPLVSFTADVERSIAALEGATIAIEGEEPLAAELADLAGALGAMPLALPTGGKPFYHAAAVMASGGLVALLDEVVALGARAGMDEAATLAVYGRLAEQTLANARAGGVSAALTGPFVRGDAGTVSAHLTALRRLAPAEVEFYLAAAWLEVRIAEDRGVLTPHQLDGLRAALAKPA